MIKVKDLVYEYPAHRALHSVCAEIKKSQITALVGPNGAGKTTLLQCLAGLEKPFSGTITVDGIDVVKYPRACHRVVGFLPDVFGLYDALTVRQSLQFFAGAGGIKDESISQAVENAAEKLWLKDRLDNAVKSLSRGMRQRLAIAQIIIKKPAVLLLDEPASGLDPGAREDLSRLFRQLKSEGVTLIVSSHILAELEQYADSLIIMDKGRVVSNEQTSAGEAAFTTVSIKVLSNMDTLKQNLLSNTQIKSVRDKGENILADVTGGPAECAAVLGQIMAQGCGIYEYKIIEQDMQSEYNRVVQSSDGGR
jgi:ABC-2 type transport system ATP-binding protein